jgi:type IV pilus assembly protein PilQ
MKKNIFILLFVSFFIINLCLYSCPHNTLALTGERIKKPVTGQQDEMQGSAEIIARLNQKVSLDYQDATLLTVLRTLGYSYDLNLVITSKVAGNITITLKDVPLHEALKAILEVNGYMYLIKGNLIYITPGPGVEGLDQETISISLKYLSADEAERLLTKVISSRGDIQINQTTNSLVITDYTSNLKKVQDVLMDIDQPPVQVLIESKIMDIQSKFYENLGTTTTVTYDPNGEKAGLFKRATGFDENLSYTSTLPGPSSNLSGGQMTLTTTLKSATTSVTLDALVQENKARLLASPSITTLNGKEARIIIGEKFPFKEKTQTTTGTTETTRFIDVGTTLKVTPMVSPDGWITMKVHPEVSSVSSALDAGPRITTREADAVIRVRDGQTIIIGGLINRKDDKTTGGIPLLKDLPVLGSLFSKRSEDKENTELTVFITPYIIKNEDPIDVEQALVNEEFYLNLDNPIGTGEIKQLVDMLTEMDEKLDTQPTSSLELFNRKQELAEAYEFVLENYPQFPQNDHLLYRLALIYGSVLNQPEKSKSLLKRVVRQYPYSSFRQRAKALLKQDFRHFEFETLYHHQDSSLVKENLILQEILAEDSGTAESPQEDSVIQASEAEFEIEIINQPEKPDSPMQFEIIEHPLKPDAPTGAVLTDEPVTPKTQPAEGGDSDALSQGPSTEDLKVESLVAEAQ